MNAAASVEEYLAGLPADSRSVLEKLRATIRKAAPDATEGIAYGMPAFKDEGRALVYYAAFENHCSFFPASRKVMDDLADELAGRRTSKGTIQFTVDEPLPAALVRKMVKARLAENAARRAEGGRR